MLEIHISISIKAHPDSKWVKQTNRMDSAIILTKIYLLVSISTAVFLLWYAVQFTS